MAAWMKEEGKAAEKAAEEANKVAVALGGTVVSLRRFRAALIG